MLKLRLLQFNPNPTIADFNRPHLSDPPTATVEVLHRDNL